MSDDSTQHAQLLERQLLGIVEEVREIRASLVTLAAVSERQTSIIERISGVNSALSDHETRLRTIEKSQPGLLEARGWIVNIVTAAVTAFGAMFLTGHMEQKPVIPQSAAPLIERRQP